MIGMTMRILRLTINGAARMSLERAPDDDAYAEEGWEEQVPIIDSTGGSEISYFD
jgi:hypothetical protein